MSPPKVSTSKVLGALSCWPTRLRQPDASIRRALNALHEERSRAAMRHVVAKAKSTSERACDESGRTDWPRRMTVIARSGYLGAGAAHQLGKPAPLNLVRTNFFTRASVAFHLSLASAEPAVGALFSGATLTWLFLPARRGETVRGLGRALKRSSMPRPAYRSWAPATASQCLHSAPGGAGDASACVGGSLAGPGNLTPHA